MPVRVVATPYGRAAAEALRAEIARAKEGSPLAPVTVIVPDNSVGVAARRLLASGELGPVSSAGAGVVGVDVPHRVPPRRAAGRAATRGGGRRPVSTAVVAAAIRRVLATEPGRCSRRSPRTPPPRRRSSPRTASSPTSTTPRSTSSPRRAAGHARSCGSTGSSRSGSRRRGTTSTTSCAPRAEIVDEGAPLVARAGHRSWCYLPAALVHPAGARLLRRARRARRDRGRRRTHRRGQGRRGGGRRASTGIGGSLDRRCRDRSPRHGTAVCSTSDADDEVRAVVRGIVDAMRAGVPLERMAVVLRQQRAVRAAAPRPPRARRHRAQRRVGAHARRLRARARLAAAARAAPTTTSAATTCSRFLASVPVLDGRGRAVPAVALGAHLARCGRRARRSTSGTPGSSRYADALAEPDDDPTGWAERQRRRARSLRRFVADARRRSRRSPPATWGGLARWAHDLVARCIGAEAMRGAVAAVRTGGGAPGRSGASTGSAGSTRSSRRRPSRCSAARSSSSSTPRATGSAGSARACSSGRRAWRSVSSSTGCGCAAWPRACSRAARRRPAARRRATGRRSAASCRCVASASPTTQRALLAALASTSGERTLCFPRGDLRRSTEHVPSRFLLDTVEAVSGQRAFYAGIEQESWFTLVPSYVYGLAHAAFPRHPSRARRARRARGRAVDRPGSRGRAAASRSCRVAAAPTSPASTATSPTAPTASSRAAPPNAEGGVGDAARDVGGVPARVLRAVPAARRAGRAPRGAHAALAARQGQHRARHARRVPRPSCVAAPASGGRGPTPSARDSTRSSTSSATPSRRAGSPGGGCCWARARRELHAELDAFLDADADVPRRRTAPTRSRPSSRSACRRRRAPRSSSVSPTARSVRVSG